jgi:hypothetical protein
LYEQRSVTACALLPPKLPVVASVLSNVNAVGVTLGCIVDPEVSVVADSAAEVEADFSATTGAAVIDDGYGVEVEAVFFSSSSSSH